MKKVLLASLIGLLFASCGNIYNFEGATLKTIPIRIEAHEWQYTNYVDNNYFFAEFKNMPEITKQVFDKGQVNVFLVNYRTDINKQHKNNLPYVMSKEQWQDGNRFLYTEVVDFTYGPGWLEINFRASDFAYEENLDINPPAMDFDVVITYPQD